jgi:ubiquitin-protein ligase E3 D
MPSPPLPASAYEALDLPSSTVKLLTTPKPAPEAAASPNLLHADPPTARQTLAPNESSITLYAELLLHIRTVTVFASLHSLHTRATRATLSADGSRITVSHEGQSAGIRLPIAAQGGGDAALELPARPPSKDLTLRLQIEEKEGENFLGGDKAEERKENVVPWDGAWLDARDGVEVGCKWCGGLVLRRGMVGRWRDLPDENWAEMMDFWHCHRPAVGREQREEEREGLEKKGYAAGNKLVAAKGAGFVDLGSLLLEEADCEGIEVSNT